MFFCVNLVFLFYIGLSLLEVNDKLRIFICDRFVDFINVMLVNINDLVLFLVFINIVLEWRKGCELN